MTLRACRERSVHDRMGWRETLNLDETDFDDLVAARVLRPELGGRLFRMEFVGVAMTAKGSIAVTPRVSGGDTYAFAALLRLMRRYFLRSAARRPYETASADLHHQDERIVREFDGYLALLAWYREHGLYRHEVKTLVEGGGRPDWRRTFARSPVLISESRALYNRPIGRRRAHNPSLIGSLQLHFLGKLSERFGYPPPPDLETNLLWSLPLTVDPASAEGSAQLAARVQAERRTVFRGDRLVLLDVLLALLNLPSRSDGPDGVRLFGTTAFYGVWEDACRHYFSSGQFAELTALAQPQWQLRTGDGNWRSEPGGEQRPDIALRAGNVRAILDAKYYVPFPWSKPGWADIVKQLYYQDCLPLEAGEVMNAFVMPGKIGERFAFAGRVEVEGVGSKSYPPIEAWLLDPRHVLDVYLSGDAPQPPSLAELLRHRAGMGEDTIQPPAHVGGQGNGVIWPSQV